MYLFPVDVNELLYKLELKILIGNYTGYLYKHLNRMSLLLDVTLTEVRSEHCIQLESL